MQNVVLAILNQLFLKTTSTDCCNQKQPPEVFYKKKLFLNISQYQQEKNLCWSLFLIKLQAFVKKRLQPRCFPVNFTKFLRTPIEYICNWLLLCNSPVLSTIIFQIHTELLFDVQLSLLRASYVCLLIIKFKEMRSYMKYNSIYMYREHWKQS